MGLNQQSPDDFSPKHFPTKCLIHCDMCRRTYRPKLRVYNNVDEDNSLNILSDKNDRASSRKLFRELFERVTVSIYSFIYFVFTKLLCHVQGTTPKLVCKLV